MMKGSLQFLKKDSEKIQQQQQQQQQGQQRKPNAVRKYTPRKSAPPRNCETKKQTTLSKDIDVSTITGKQFVDEHGQLTIRADSFKNAFYFWGDYIASNFLWNNQQSKLAGEGRLAEIFGPDQFETDVQVRATGYTNAEYDAQYAEMSSKARDNIDYFILGFNTRLSQLLVAAQQDPSVLPAEFLVLGFTPEPLDRYSYARASLFFTMYYSGVQFHPTAQLENLVHFLTIHTSISTKYGEDMTLEELNQMILDIFNDLYGSKALKPTMTIVNDGTWQGGSAASVYPVPNPPIVEAELKSRSSDASQTTKQHGVDGDEKFSSLEELKHSAKQAEKIVNALKKSKTFLEKLPVLKSWGSYCANFSDSIIKKKHAWDRASNSIMSAGPQAGQSVPGIFNRVRIQIGEDEFDHYLASVSGFPAPLPSLLGYNTSPWWRSESSNKKDTVDDYTRRRRRQEGWQKPFKHDAIDYRVTTSLTTSYAAGRDVAFVSGDDIELSHTETFKIKGDPDEQEVDIYRYKQGGFVIPPAAYGDGVTIIRPNTHVVIRNLYMNTELSTYNNFLASLAQLDGVEELSLSIRRGDKNEKHASNKRQWWPPFGKSNLEKINQRMLEIASKSDSMGFDCYLNDSEGNIVTLEPRVYMKTPSENLRTLPQNTLAGFNPIIPNDAYIAAGVYYKYNKSAYFASWNNLFCSDMEFGANGPGYDYHRAERLYQIIDSVLGARPLIGETPASCDDDDDDENRRRVPTTTTRKNKHYTEKTQRARRRLTLQNAASIPFEIARTADGSILTEAKDAYYSTGFRLFKKKFFDAVEQSSKKRGTTNTRLLRTRQDALDLLRDYDGGFVEDSLNQVVNSPDVLDAFVLAEAWIAQLSRLLLNPTLEDTDIADILLEDNSNLAVPKFRFVDLTLRIVRGACENPVFYDWLDGDDLDELIVEALDSALELLGPQPWGKGARDVFYYGMIWGQPIRSIPRTNLSSDRIVAQVSSDKSLNDILYAHPLGFSGTTHLGPYCQNSQGLPIASLLHDDFFFSTWDYHRTFNYIHLYRNEEDKF